jgi:hypothetical protein
MNNPKEYVQLKEHYIADVTLKFPTGMKREGQFGPYLIYTVIHEGKEKFLKVTDRLEKQIRKFDAKTGQVLSLLKETVTPKNGEPFTVINVLECKDAPKPEKRVEAVTQNVENTVLIPQTPEGFSSDTLMMYQSLQDAVDITKMIEGVEWRNTDVEKIGVCLFLSRVGQLTTEQVLANGNGNGKKNLRTKKIEDAKPVDASINIEQKPKEISSVYAEATAEKDDLPF